MDWILIAIIAGTITFAATNIDDIFVLMLFFSQTNQSFRRWHIVAGQYLGFTALVLISLLGFLVGLLAPREWIGLLGLVPIFIGVRGWLNRNKNRETELEPAPGGSNNFSAVLSVAVVTFANGGDNIGIYAPLFAGSDFARLAVMLAVFYVLLGAWCFVGYAVTRQPLVARVLARYGHLLVPFVLVGLGIYILLENRTFSLVVR